ncbi:MAG: hypothetical protein HYX32_08600 [Actinobacteria bacterium]|nr:hypothetical protein [Actinomycetota bacterium]
MSAKPSRPPNKRGTRGGRTKPAKAKQNKAGSKPKQVQNPPRDRLGSPGTRTRKLAAELLRRIDQDGAYANIVVPDALDHSELPERDRKLVTELVYGATRRQRSCDWLVDRYTSTEPDAVVRSFLRVGAYQLAFTDIPPYAAVSATVAATPVKVRPFVNAVLRKLVKEAKPAWPSEAVRLSYPDWIVDRLGADLGDERAMAALETMNAPPPVTRRDDGYVQDLASQWVAATVGAAPGERVLDLCAAPGGKTTAMAQAGADVVALDQRPRRTALIASNVARLHLSDRVSVVAGDGTRPPWPDSTRFDRVLVDAPCSGLGALRRRPDARWRIGPSDVGELAVLQRGLLDAAAGALRPGGRLVFSVCTLTNAETVDIDDWLGADHPELLPAGAEPAGPGGESPWEPVGRGFLLLPQTADTDGMYLLALTKGQP